MKKDVEIYDRKDREEAWHVVEVDDIAHYWDGDRQRVGLVTKVHLGKKSNWVKVHNQFRRVYFDEQPGIDEPGRRSRLVVLVVKRRLDE